MIEPEATAPLREQAMTIINMTITTINDFWSPGAPFDSGVWARWNDSLAEAIRRGDLRTVWGNCARYQTWMAKQVE